MIKIIFLDVDGCMSDGGIYKGNNGEEFKKFDVKDGFGIEQWNKMGKVSAIITGKISQIVENRAKELGIKYCFQGVKDKFAKAQEILKSENLSFKNAAAIGDDLNDLRLLKAARFSFAPADAHKMVSKNAKFKLEKSGGKGAIREMIEIIIKKENLQDEWFKKWF